MSFDLSELQRAVAAHGVVWRVVVAETRGSVPREVGASMLVWEEGQGFGQSGTIGGGALELQAAERASGLAADSVTRHPLGPELGQCCGGAVTLLTERFDAARVAEMGPGPLRRLGDSASEPPLAITRALAQARDGRAPLQAMFKDGWMLEPQAAETRPLWIWGAGHVGRAIVQVLSPLAEFDITWVDTAQNRFPEDVPQGVTPVVAAEPARLVGHAPADAEHLILTYSHEIDFALCAALLSHDFAYAGLIGSKTKWARFKKRLTQLGHSPLAIGQITCPIGDPSLGKAPSAIAIGVAHERLSAGVRAANLRQGLA